MIRPMGKLPWRLILLAGLFVALYVLESHKTAAVPDCKVPAWGYTKPDGTKVTRCEPAHIVYGHGE